ncbi:MAG: hypothetical protein ACR2OG_02680 [Gemmatimonadaceae bacterium]
MSRSLVLQRTVVPIAERSRFLEQIRARRVHYETARCRFWLFEEADLPGAYIEFVEAADSATLAAALERAPHAYAEAVRIYQQVEPE